MPCRQLLPALRAPVADDLAVERVGLVRRRQLRVPLVTRLDRIAEAADAAPEPAAAAAAPPLLPGELDDGAEALTAAPMSTPATDDSFEWPAAKPKRTTGGGRRPPLAIIGAVVAAIMASPNAARAIVVFIIFLRRPRCGPGRDGPGFARVCLNAS